MRRFASSLAALTSERYPHIRRGPYSLLSDKVLSRLESALGRDRLLTDPNDLMGYNVDWIKMCRGASQLVIRPKETAEVSAAMKICSEENIAVVPQGGNTGLVGGSVPVFDEVIMSMSSMNKIHEIDDVSGYIISDAGCVLENLSKVLEDRNLMMPLDLGAKGSCQIGGNISTCAGGLRLLRYGSLQANTLGLEVVLADGTVLNLLNKLKKDNTGYHLRQLFIGSEGTLGIVTKAAIATPTKPQSINLAYLGLSSFENVLSTFVLARKHLSETLSSCEMMDAASIASVEKILGLKPPLCSSHQFYMIIETHGSSVANDMEKLNEFLSVAMDKGHVQDGTVADEPSRMTKLWETRERITESFSRQHYVFKYDITVPLNIFYDIVLVMRERLKSYPEETLVSGFGHIGDGNLHLNIRCNAFSPKLEALIEPFVFQWTSEHSGSISAEHGIGFKKTQYLHYSKTNEAIRTMENIKTSLDPKGILNPYKVLPIS